MVGCRHDHGQNGPSVTYLIMFRNTYAIYVITDMIGYVIWHPNIKTTRSNSKRKR